MGDRGELWEASVTARHAEPWPAGTSAAWQLRWARWEELSCSHRGTGSAGALGEGASEGCLHKRIRLTDQLSHWGEREGEVSGITEKRAGCWVFSFCRHFLSDWRTCPVV